jgi:hypothetical protein
MWLSGSSAAGFLGRFEATTEVLEIIDKATAIVRREIEVRSDLINAAERK